MGAKQLAPEPCFLHSGFLEICDTQWWFVPSFLISTRKLARGISPGKFEKYIFVQLICWLKERVKSLGTEWSLVGFESIMGTVEKA